jgi:DNA-binding transcriptional LysR family regulator
MELRKLDVFCKIVELKSFTRTAEAVLLSQPTVSEHIRNLEEELGQKLVDRLGREVLPTPAGKLLYGYAKKIQRLQHDALQAIEQYSGKLIGRLMLGSGTIPGTYILPYIIGQFRGEYPSIKATLRIAGSRLIAKEVVSGELELGVIGANWNDASLEWQEIFSDHLALVVHPKHRWANRDSVNPEELLTEPFILRETDSGTRKVVEQILADHGIKAANMEEVAEIGSTAAIKEAVRAGLGVSILSERAVADDVRYGTLTTVALKGVRLERPFYIIRRKNRELSPVASVFQDYLLLEAEKMKKPKKQKTAEGAKAGKSKSGPEQLVARQ